MPGKILGGNAVFLSQSKNYLFQIFILEIRNLVLLEITFDHTQGMAV